MALVIRRGGVVCGWKGISIALISHSLDPSLSTRLRDLLSRSLSGRLIADEKQAI